MTLSEIDRELAIRKSQLGPIQKRIEFLQRERERITGEVRVNFGGLAQGEADLE